MKCFYCGETKTKHIGMISDKLNNNKVHLSCLVECINCGIMRVDPFPTLKKYLSLYSDGYYNFEWMEKRGYLEHDNRFQHDCNIAKQRLAFITGYKSKGIILDIGCSNGGFLFEAKKQGFACYGIESNKKIIDCAKKLSGIKSIFFNYNDLPKKVNIITMHDVFEHFYAPGKELKKINKITKRKCLLVIEIPDVNSLQCKNDGMLWKHFRPSEHLYYLGFKHVRNLVEELGFKLHKVLFPIEGKIAMYFLRE